jgi:hypothetical protein
MSSNGEIQRNRISNVQTENNERPTADGERCVSQGIESQGSSKRNKKTRTEEGGTRRGD